MTTATRTAAQQRADEIHVFQRELQRLEQEGVVTLSDAQHQSIAVHHDQLLGEFAQAFDIDRDVRAKQLSLGMRVASFLGALALGASVFFLFFQFWGGFATTTQVGILVAVALGSFLGTAWIHGRDSTGYFTKLAALVAFTCFVLNVVMLGEIFNLTPSDKALVAWAALAFLLAYACDLRLLLAVGILCVTGFIAARTGTWGGLYWLDFGERPENFFPAALLFFLLPQFVAQDRYAGFAALYRVFALIILFLPMLVLANWGHGSYLALDADTIEGGYQLLGFAGSAAAIWLGARRQWAGVVNTGVTFFVIFLYTKFFDWWWAIMPKYLFFLVLGLTAVLVLLVLQRLRGTGHALQKGGA